MTASRKSSFAPVIAPGTRVLILGSLPGERSLAAGRYYAHPQNQFWRLVGSAIGHELEALAYDARLEALLVARIGLWDTVASATRTGSLDAAIREAEHNPLADLVATLPDLRAIAFNGATSARIGMTALAGSALAGSALALLPLPSSSPAYAAMPFAEKRRLWTAIGEFLGEPLASRERQPQ
ncbi:MAG: DNA-deoxyinosine glycosylase [Croceibacterium sp.]